MAVGNLCAPSGPEARYSYRKELTRQPRFAHAGHVAYPTQCSHTNIIFDALDSNVFVKLIGCDSVDSNLVHSDAALSRSRGWCQLARVPTRHHNDVHEGNSAVAERSWSINDPR